jgi:tripartite-type tricarboxylate transporter receptor subunit TctC
MKHRTATPLISLTGYAIAMVGASLMFTTQANGADFPDHSVDVVIPMAAGGPTDIVGRVIQKKMGEALGEPVVIENRAGAAGMIGVGIVRRSAPDGYMLVMASSTTHAIAVNVYKKIPYDPIKDFTAIGGIVVAPGVLITSHKAAPGCTMAAFIANLKKEPGKMQFGSSGTGSLAHMSGMRFLYATHTSMLHVPYKGLSGAMTDLYSGQIDAAFDNVSSALPHIKSGKLCALAVQAPSRLAVLPDVPTYAELGFPQLNTPTWYGMVGPAGMPPAVVTKLNKALNYALASPEVKATFDRLGLTAWPTTPDGFATTVKTEIAQWKLTTEQIKFQKISQ